MRRAIRIGRSMSVPDSIHVARYNQRRAVTDPRPFSDTDPETERVQLELLRNAGPARRGRMALELSALVITLARRGLRSTLPPGATEQDAALRFVELYYSPELAVAVRRRLTERTP
jgi:hypothetical protein